ncbi:hypothetical protein PVK06_032419 [Gossypium arboreum]|uniref:Uncharacterized protein n=1 Tax=Gossypium arboreum TaxID=29729 RepID=A0ABR0NTV1_GOSAR|nr:hypothetical protein PVK06_032419 [Gossypium arboreum]
MRRQDINQQQFLGCKPQTKSIIYMEQYMECEGCGGGWVKSGYNMTLANARENVAISQTTQEENGLVFQEVMGEIAKHGWNLAWNTQGYLVLEKQIHTRTEMSERGSKAIHNFIPDGMQIANTSKAS